MNLLLSPLPGGLSALPCRRAALYNTDATGTTSYTYYDGTAQVNTVDGPLTDDTLTYYYDGLGRVSKVEQQGADTMEYVYDTFGRLSTAKVGDRTRTYAYTGANKVPDSLTRPNGSITTYKYNNLYMLTEITNGTIDSYKFKYDALMRKGTETATGATPATFTAGSATYTHNSVNQLREIRDTSPIYCGSLHLGRDDRQIKE